MEVDSKTELRRFAEMYKDYTLTGTAYLDFRDIKELVRKYVKGKETLDYGCGPGVSTNFLKSLELNVKGVDISEDAIKYAREKDVDGSYEAIASAKVPADNNTYDLVYSGWVTDHISTKSELCAISQEISRILKPNGIFIMSVGSKDTYNRNFLTRNSEFPENQTLYSGSRIKILLKDINLLIHGYFWTEEDYKEMIESANMTILEIHSPLGQDSDGYDWKDEKKVSPLHIYVAKKNE